MNPAVAERSAEARMPWGCKHIPGIAALAAIVTGVLVFIGWLTGSLVLLSVIPGYSTMKPNTAFCIILGGFSLWLLRSVRDSSAGTGNAYRRLGQAFALILVCVGALTLGEHFFGLNLGIDQSLLRDMVDNPRMSPPGRMSIASAFDILTLGVALFLLGVEGGKSVLVSQSLALIGLVNAVIAGLGYLYDPHGLYAVMPYTTIAMHTTITLALLCAGVVFSRPDQGLMVVITSEYGGGQMARLILPFAIVLPYVIGWLRLKGEDAGLFGTHFGAALFATANIVTFTILIWIGARSLNARAAEAAQSEHRFRFLADAMPQIVWTATPEGNGDYFNRTWFDYTGLATDKTKKGGLAPAVHPDDLPDFVQRWMGAVGCGGDFEGEWRLRRGSDGAYRWHLARAFPMRDADGKIIQWVGTLTDVDDQKRAREALEQRVRERTAELFAATARLQSVLDSATNAAIITVTPDGIITLYNTGAERMLGYSPEEVVGRQTPRIFHLESETIARGLELSKELGRPIHGFDAFVEKARRGLPEEREWTFVRKDGSHLTVNLAVTAWYDLNGDIAGFLGVAMDITARKKAEETLRVSEERFRLVADAIKDYAILMLDAQGCVANWNAGAERIKGYKADEIIGRHFSCFYTPEDIAGEVPDKALHIAATEGRFADEGWRVRKDGTRFFAEVVLTAIRDETGELRGFAKVTRDITEHRLAEKALRDQALMLDLAHDTILIRDEDDRVTYWNQGAQRLYGWTREQAVGRTSHELFKTRFPVPLDEIKAQVLATGHWEGELVHVRRYGSEVTVSSRWTLMRDDSGQPASIVEMNYDITARKNAERELQESSERLNVILNSCLDGIIVFESVRDDAGVLHDFRFSMVNPSTERLMGKEASALLGHRLQEVFPNAATDGLIEKYFRIVEENIALDFEHQSRYSDPPRWYRIAGAKLGDGLVVSYSEITLRKSHEEELRLSEERFSSAFEHSTTGMALVSLDGQWLKVNQATSDLLGYSAEELCSTDFQHITHPDDLEADLAWIRLLIGGEIQFYKMEKRYFHKNGDIVWALLGVTLLRDKFGMPLYFISQIEDITEMKQAMERQEHLTLEAQAAERAKRDFLANMSHEIRTPMNGVIGMTRLLLDTGLDAEQRRLAETACHSAESLLSLINDILDFSKIEAGQMVFEEIDFELRDVVGNTLEMMAGQAQDKGIEMVGGVEPGAVTALRGDPSRIQQLLTNLISNAVKFTERGEVSVRVTSNEEAGGGVLVRFEIKDTGIGIKAETQARLFNSFVQADSSTSRRFGGTGLGLAICKRMAESMKGAIGVESEPGRGSTFWVTMRLSRQTSPDAPEPRHELDGARVLVIDGNKTRREFLQRQISAWRLRGDCTGTGAEALAMLGEAAAGGGPYSLAVVDLQLPDMDGLELARRIHADPVLNTIRLVLLAPFGKPVPPDELKAANIAACCTKPVRPSDLFDCLVRARTGLDGDEVRQVELPAWSSQALPPRTERVLLAEDNTVNQQVALRNLRKLGYKADVASNGRRVLEALKNKNYDIILMDCQMPEMDGCETTREIRRMEKGVSHVWIIAMTANVMVGDREKCLSAGMDDYLGKPLRTMELRAALERVPAKI